MISDGEGMPTEKKRLSKNSPTTQCHACRHYYVTWDKQFPHGCKAMGFKSKTLPAFMVRNASGINCLLFGEKTPRERR